MNERAGGYDPPSDRPRTGLGPRPVVWGAFGLSAALHVLFIVVYPSLFAELEPESLPRSPSEIPPPDGIEVIRLAEAETVQVTEPEEPDEIEEEDEPAVEVPTENLDEVPVVELGIGAAERLRPQLEDPRLWAPLPPEFWDLTPEDREELLVAARLAEWYDSLSAAEAAQSAWTDWTFTDGSGRRWGIADGMIYLGDYAVPFSFAPPPGAARERASRASELERQRVQMLILDTVRERIQAIRERRDRERARERADTARSSR